MCIDEDATDGTTEKQPSDLENAKFFVIKSYSEDDVYKVIIELKQVN